MREVVGGSEMLTVRGGTDDAREMEDGRTWKAAGGWWARNHERSRTANRMADRVARGRGEGRPSPFGWRRDFRFWDAGGVSDVETGAGCVRIPNFGRGRRSGIEEC